MNSDAEDPSGKTGAPAGQWERLGVVDWKLAVAVTAPVTLMLATFVLPQLVSPFTRELALWARILIIVLTAAVGSLIAVVIARLRTPQVFVNTTERLISTRRASVLWSELDQADLVVTESGARRTVILLLRSGKAFRVPVVLRRWNERPLGERTQELAAEVIRGSSIAMPVSKDDPTGSFALFNFPTSITKEEALAVVESPPALGDPLPIPPQR